jgi:two-component system, OmpR family, sensor histidine kinase BaeS
MRWLDPGRLHWRLLAGNLVVAAAGAITVAIAVSLAAPVAFEHAMGSQGAMAGMGTMMSSAVTAAFGDAVGSALVLGVGAATLIAIVVAAIISIRLARPISCLAEASREVAGGDYAQRVPVGSGELGDLAASFNEMAASLDATERRRHELIGDVAHELRTPIASLRGYIEGLDEGVFTPGPDAWRVLGDQASRLSRLVDDLSDLWRAEADDIALVAEDLDGPRLVLDAIERHRAAAVARSIELVGEADAPVRVRADRARVAQVIDNLAGNAIRYTPERGSVRIRLEQRGNVAQVSVSDTGPGLTRDQLAQVFERFYRVDPSRSRDVGGSGLGLAIAKALSEAMGGRIWATSPGAGQGSTFYLELPVANRTPTRGHLSIAR